MKGMVVIEHKEDLHPQIVIVDPKTKEVLASYSIPAGAHLVRQGRRRSSPAARCWPRRRARSPRPRTSPAVCRAWPSCSKPASPRTPARSPRSTAIVDFGGTVRGKRCVVVTDPETGEEEEHLIPMGKHVIVTKGDQVKKGQQLTEGPVSPQKILEVCGPQELQEHLVNEVQEVYRLQGVEINDKHIEIIVRQMLRKVRITDPGDTDSSSGASRSTASTSKRVNARDRRQRAASPPKREPVLLGITKASLETDRFISAASFQDTTRVLTDAATLGKVDYLRGFKENVIMGHLIPAGTGFPCHRDSEFEFTVEEPEPVVAGPRDHRGGGRQRHGLIILLQTITKSPLGCHHGQGVIVLRAFDFQARCFRGFGCGFLFKERNMSSDEYGEPMNGTSHFSPSLHLHGMIMPPLK